MLNIKRYLLAALFFFFMHHGADAQLTISGTVYDSTRIVPVKGVLVTSTNGTRAITDSNGHYSIVVTDKDSLIFSYNNKPTNKFVVKQIQQMDGFDISIKVRVTEKFRTMKEVRVFAKSYKQDSIENRMQNAKAFQYQKPGIASNGSAYSGASGLDLDEFINLFRKKRNRSWQRLQERLVSQEEENYIKYRFNKTLVKRITHLEGAQLDSFMVAYRPDFAFTRNSSVPEFYQYILDCSYLFKSSLLQQEGKKEEGAP